MKEAMEVMLAPSSANWSNLLEELLQLILAKLNLMDHIRFSSVCKQWRSVAADSSTMKKSISLVYTDRPYNLLRRLLLRSVCISLHNVKIVGGFEGWLVIDRGLELTLFNPSSGEAPILLPRILDAPGLEKYTYTKKVILSSNPRSSTGECTIVLSDFIGRLFVCNLGDAAWTLFYDKPTLDMAFHRNKLYVINTKGLVDVFVSGFYSSPSNCVILPLSEGYLVSASDKLLVIGMYYKDKPLRENGCHVPWSKYKLIGIKVYVLDQMDLSYIEMESFGDNIMFFNPIFSLYRSAQDHPELPPNHLYFAKFETVGGYISAGGYSLDDKAIVTFGKTRKGYLVFLAMSSRFYPRSQFPQLSPECDTFLSLS